jgi:hypothetical protein
MRFGALDDLGMTAFGLASGFAPRPENLPCRGSSPTPTTTYTSLGRRGRPKLRSESLGHGLREEDLSKGAIGLKFCDVWHADSLYDV